MRPQVLFSSSTKKTNRFLNRKPDLKSDEFGKIGVLTSWICPRNTQFYETEFPGYHQVCRRCLGFLGEKPQAKLAETCPPQLPHVEEEIPGNPSGIQIKPDR